MATVTQLADRLCDATGLATTGSDRTRALLFLNQAYAMALEDDDVPVSVGGTATLTSGTADYAIGTTPFNASTFLRFKQVWISSGGSINNLRLKQVAEWDLRSMRETSASSGSDVVYYAVTGNSEIMFYPSPASAIVIGYSYIRLPKNLHESTSDTTNETTPSDLPLPYHFRVIGNGGIALAFEFKRDMNMAQYYWGKYEEGMQHARDYVREIGGDEVADWLPSRDGQVLYRDAVP